MAAITGFPVVLKRSVSVSESFLKMIITAHKGAPPERRKIKPKGGETGYARKASKISKMKK